MFGVLADLVTLVTTALLVGLLGSYIASRLALLLRGRHPWRWARALPARAVCLLWAAILGALWTWLALLILRFAERHLLDTAAHGPAWIGFWWLAFVAAGIVAPLAAILRQALATADAMMRIAVLLQDNPGGFECTPHRRAVTPPTAFGRRIVIFCDGTRNSPDETEGGQPATTNVHRMCRALIDDDTQTVWYDAGVGSGTSNEAGRLSRLARTVQQISPKIAGRLLAVGAQLWNAVEAATGAGITENIVQAYTEVVRQYKPRDRIYLFGFSRGAFTARCVAGVIDRCGLLKAENLRFAGDVVRLYRTRCDVGDDANRPDGEQHTLDSDVPIARAMIHDRDIVAVEVLGVFDTVASLGAPLWGWWFRIGVENRALGASPAPICRHVYHALSMDERRSTFFPALFAAKSPESWTDTLEQVWFRGAHGDIGGGYSDTGLSEIALRWMTDKARQHGLEFQSGFPGGRDQPLSRIHDELRRQPFWRLLGSWPRWHPVHGNPASDEFGALHPTVTERAVALQDDFARFDLRFLTEGGQPVPIITEAHREWDRTGIVIEGYGAYYELRWVAGYWRDKEAPLCGPAGQRPRRGDLRRWFGWRKRVPEAGWMVLCASIAHPRDWQMREQGFLTLLRYLFVRDPDQLRQQVIAVGEYLTAPGSAVVLQNNAQAGMLYLFANDWWQTAPNNSGGVELAIRRLAPHEEPVDPVLTLTREGIWK